MKDYFAALASRVLQPERSVQPRPRVPFASSSVSGSDLNDPFASTEREVEPRTQRAAMSERAAVTDAGKDDAEASSDGPSKNGRLRQTPRGSSRRQRSMRNESDAEQHDPISFFEHPSVVAPRASRQTGAKRGSIESAPSMSGAVHREMSEKPISKVVPGQRRANDAVMQTSSSVAPSSPDRVIRIHIGRVDVRAIQSSPAQTQTRPDAQRRALMTLEEYVRQRGGERS